MSYLRTKNSSFLGRTLGHVTDGPRGKDRPPLDRSNPHYQRALHYRRVPVYGCRR
jgi:hypothetical protein